MLKTSDPLGFAAARRRTFLTAYVLIAVLAALFSLGLIVGPTPLSVPDVFRVLSHHVFHSALPHHLITADAIVWDIRTPRLVLGVFIGASLSVSGAILQAVVRNILADPYVLGINSGASTGAALAILFGVGAGFGAFALQASAFIGACAAAGLMFAVAYSAGRLTSTRLLMAGIAVGYALAAVTSFLIFASDSAEGARSVMFWLLGSLALGDWNIALALTCLTVTVISAAFWAMGKHIDILSIGDDPARTMGLNPDRTRLLLVLMVCLLVAAAVSMAGSIGFVGLIVPHAARRLVGGTHRHLLPICALLGAVLLVAADIGARFLLAPQEIPIGILTALVGAPFLLLLVRNMAGAS
ncbi:FecCD family ABC transporter permease [Corynebacterium phocae]|uniref:FecCD family ABC transporter permease n=1 Tax=Corynebacterium phocae TaxID=161895 RepID=UPI000A485A4A|nr:iron ABC transporter permease [Corynebacterium phocae]KAA8726971.1 iron ABC transporter permease [Corynebacterium phocae]